MLFGTPPPVMDENLSMKGMLIAIRNELNAVREENTAIRQEMSLIQSQFYSRSQTSSNNTLNQVRGSTSYIIHHQRMGSNVPSLMS